MVGFGCTAFDIQERVKNPLPHRLLLIEETKDVQRVIQLGLELIAGFEVVCMQPSASWLELVNASPPSLILLDMFPKGNHILSTLRKTSETQTLPVICIVARDRTYDYLQATKQGATAIVAKPFDLYHLADTIHEILDIPTQD